MAVMSALQETPAAMNARLLLYVRHIKSKSAYQVIPQPTEIELYLLFSLSEDFV